MIIKDKAKTETCKYLNGIQSRANLKPVHRPAIMNNIHL
jgi:hypothetical protein